MKMPFLLISPKIVPKIQLIKKGGCFEYHAVIADKIKYRYVHRASICPALGMDRRSFFMPKPMGKYKRLEVFYLSKPVYTADKPSDCHYCYFWTNGRKGCRLGRNNCYYLISLPPKPKGSIQTTQEVEIYFNFVGRFVPPAFGEVELTPEELEEIRKREERKDRLHQNYLKRKANGKQKEYEERTKAKKKAEIEARKQAIRTEDIARGVFIPVSSLPQLGPRKGA